MPRNNKRKKNNKRKGKNQNQCKNVENGNLPKILENLQESENINLVKENVITEIENIEIIDEKINISDEQLIETTTNTNITSDNNDKVVLTNGQIISVTYDVNFEQNLNKCDLSDDKGQIKVENPIIKELQSTSNYRVESPKPLIKNPQIGNVKKSRSLDDEDDTFQIQEMSDASSSSEMVENAIISEAESEVEMELTEITEDLTIQTLPLELAEIIDLSPPVDESIDLLIQTTLSKEDDQDDDRPKQQESNEMKLRRAKKRAALESHFLPQILNPRYLDIIKEESDTSDIDRKSDIDHSKYDDYDDDVFLDNTAISKKANAVFPKMNLDFSSIRKHVSQLRSPNSPIIREEPQLVLVDTKIIDRESVEESCSSWTTRLEAEESNAEQVYLESSSSSTSDLDYTGEADDEGLDSDVRVQTPVIDGKSPLFPISDGNNNKNLISDDDNKVNYFKKSVCDNQKNTNLSFSDVLNFKIGEPCSYNMFSPHQIANSLTKTNLNGENNKEFNRQDSSGSLSSSHSHSTSSHSQSTARYFASDLVDSESSACLSDNSMGNNTNLPKTLRQICVETLASMPFGSAVLEELANVAESLSNLTAEQQIKLKEMPYPVPELPKIDEIVTVRNDDMKTIRIVPVEKLRSPPPPPIPEPPKYDSWMGVPTEEDPNILLCFSPSQRHLIKENRIVAETSADSLLDMHKKYIERRGYHEYSDSEINRLKNERERETGAKDNNRLLAIIREQEQSNTEDSKCSDEMFTDNPFKKRYSNIETTNNSINKIEPPKRYSNIETTTYETKKRIENGNVVFEFSDMKKEKASSDKDLKLKQDDKSYDIIIEKLKNRSENVSDTKPNKQSEEKYSFKEFNPKIFENDFFKSDFPIKRTESESYHKEESKKEDYKFESNTMPSKSSFSDRMRLASQNLDDWMRHTNPTNENNCKTKKINIEIRAPRLSSSTANLCESSEEINRHYDMLNTQRNKVLQTRQSMIDETPISRHETRRMSLPKEVHEKQLEYIRLKEKELQAEFEKLERDRLMLQEEMSDDFYMNHKKSRSQSIEPQIMSEAEFFRQQMHDEWLNKVAEREERRLHKIIKISKPSEEDGLKRSESQDIGDEFLHRVKERRSKLKMPSDSDWESGAESQPVIRKDETKKTVKIDPTIKVIEGEKEADLKNLPKHLQEFMEFSSSMSTKHSETLEKNTNSAVSKKDGESISFIGLMCAIVFLGWSVCRALFTNR